MTIRKTTEKEQQLIKTLVHTFFDLELEVRKHFESKFEPNEMSELIAMALINYIGNFIHLNCKGKKNKDYNFQNFINNLKKWQLSSEKQEH
jgi:hypothetical protein